MLSLGYGGKPVRLKESKVTAGRFNHGLTAEHWKEDRIATITASRDVLWQPNSSERALQFRKPSFKKASES
ncbi:hypothetical protein SAMN05216387_10786 [Nitrosovibrio tenuis]|uniref:Uncharacterized protein n=1 Tax=Nitrosovibrio tenuis TaxID=1233 RepID=A0A1H7NP97_9PROT|nr:hypothetical protein SAMN05216387_10786 [Nitrosovibrio tenuis]